MTIAALTIENDLHAHLIRHELKTRHGLELRVIEVDRLSAQAAIDWRLDDAEPRCRIRIDGRWVAVEELKVAWWRRSRASQLIDGVSYPPEQADVIDNDCRSSLTGAFTTCFRGTWLSEPTATERAGNKLYQLSVAKRCGFRIPETLISQDPQSVRSFVERLRPRRVVVKTVAGGGKGLFLFTQFVTDAELRKTDSISVCPAIYQEYIEGDSHLRVNCFGDRSYAGRIVTGDLDWRPNLSVPVTRWQVPEDLHAKVRRVLDELGLAMGVVDLKVTPEGEYVWLEVNPQGQFLFLEPLTRTPYTRLFAEYLASAAANQ